MSTLTIPRLSERTHARLLRRAAENGRSVEAEVRAILDAAVGLPDESTRRCQVVEAMGGCPRRSRSKDSRGVRKPSVARGRSLSSSAIAVR